MKSDEAIGFLRHGLQETQPEPLSAMSNIRWHTLVLAISIAPCLAFAQAKAPSVQDPIHEEENTGQDPTKPLARIDLRYKYEDNPGGLESNTLTLRGDKPFFLGGGWKLSTRVDLPFIMSDAPSRDNPNGDDEFGFSDILVQALFVTRRTGNGRSPSARKPSSPQPARISSGPASISSPHRRGDLSIARDSSGEFRRCARPRSVQLRR